MTTVLNDAIFTTYESPGFDDNKDRESSIDKLLRSALDQGSFMFVMGRMLHAEKARRDKHQSLFSDEDRLMREILYIMDNYLPTRTVLEERKMMSSSETLMVNISSVMCGEFGEADPAVDNIGNSMHRGMIIKELGKRLAKYMVMTTSTIPYSVRIPVLNHVQDVPEKN